MLLGFQIALLTYGSFETFLWFRFKFYTQQIKRCGQCRNVLKIIDESTKKTSLMSLWCLCYLLSAISAIFLAFLLLTLKILFSAGLQQVNINFILLRVSLIYGKRTDPLTNIRFVILNYQLLSKSIFSTLRLRLFQNIFFVQN